MSWPGILPESGLLHADDGHARERVVDVACGAPELGSDTGPQLPDFVYAVLAQAVNNGTMGGAQSLTLFLKASTIRRLAAGGSP